MKFKFEVKGRAALREAIEAAAKRDFAAQFETLKLGDDEVSALVKARVKATLDACKLWSADGTTFTIEIDTEALSCSVVEAPSKEMVPA